MVETENTSTHDSKEDAPGEATAKCSSCLDYAECEESIKDSEICSKYHTRIHQLFDGKLVSFHCVPNNVFSEWRKRADCNSVEIASELHVRPKDVFKILVNDNVPIKRPKTTVAFPIFDLSDEKNIDKQHIRYEIAQWLLKEQHFITMRDTDEIHIYNEGIYEPIADEIIIEAIRQTLGEYCTVYDRNETKAIIRDATITDRSVFDVNPEMKICLENGVLNLDTQAFLEHSPDQYFLTKLPLVYDPDAQCPLIDEFSKQIVDKSDVQTLYEIIGYCLLRDYPIHKAFMGVGGGANGKSVYLNLIKTFLGNENVSGLSLQQLLNSRFSTSALVGKYANIYGDIPSKALGDTGIFKMLTGNDNIGAEHKWGKHFTFQNHAKLLFSTNKIPETKDDTDAFFRRWIIIVFPNQFTNYSKPKADPNKLEKLTTQEELSGLLNKALQSLAKLLSNRQFHGDKPTAEWRVDYIRKSDPIAAFYMDCLIEIPDPDIYISKADLYQAFVNYCKENKLPRVDNTVFSRKIKSYFQMAQDSTVGQHGGKRKLVWRNLALQSEKENLAEKGVNIDEYF